MLLLVGGFFVPFSTNAEFNAQPIVGSTISDVRTMLGNDYKYSQSFEPWENYDVQLSDHHRSWNITPTADVCSPTGIGNYTSFGVFSTDSAIYTDSNKTVDYYFATYPDAKGIIANCDNSGNVVSSIFVESTQIYTVTPVNATTTATSTSFSIGATGYVTDDDFDTDLKVRIKLTYNGSLIANSAIVAGLNSACFTASLGTLGFACNALLGVDLTSTYQDFDIATSGSFSVSTTTSILTGGAYTMTTSIIKPYFTILGFEVGTQSLVSYTSSFIAGATTIYDDFVDNVDDFIQDGYTNFNGTSCNVVSGSFDFGECIIGLVLPSGNTFAIYGQIPELLMTRFPFSYVSGIAYTWNSLENGTTASPTLAFNYADLGIGSTSPMGNILPNLTVFSSSTVGTYLNGSILTAFKALVSLALILGLFANIFFSIKRIFDND